MTLHKVTKNDTFRTPARNFQEVKGTSINREDIIALAQEAIIENPNDNPFDFRLSSIEAVERFAALVAAAVLDRPRRRRSPLRRDAERYRWLRGMIYDDRIIVAADRMLHGEALDAAVDAAMRQEQPR